VPLAFFAPVHRPGRGEQHGGGWRLVGLCADNGDQKLPICVDGPNGTLFVTSDCTDPVCGQQRPQGEFPTGATIAIRDFTRAF